MGTFEKTYLVDGERFELYASTDGEARFQLVDGDNLPIGEPFDAMPDEDTVAGSCAPHARFGESAG